MRSEKLCSGAKRFLIALVVALVSADSTWAAQEKILHDFVDLPHGANPQSSLTADAAGNLYGTAYGGGKHAAGAVFRLSKGSDGVWTESVLYSFFGLADGGNPIGSLIWDSAGSLYGTTTYGGYSNSGGCNGGCGVVFKLTPGSGGNWSQSVLYSFRGYQGDGSNPSAALVFDSGGNLYGTTQYGGPSNSGTVFKLTPAPSSGWTESVLYAFSGGADGAYPGAGLTFDKVGNLYSTTASGGDLNCGGFPGCGTVFELVLQTNGTWKETVLHNFQGTPAFLNLSTSVLVDSHGDLYGTTSTGEFFYGSVFRLRRHARDDWNYETLYSFAGGKDGYAPSAGLIFDARGRLYGTTQYGGVISGQTPCPYQIGCGTVFEITPHSGGASTENVLHRFTGGGDGAQPLASLISDQSGNLYTPASAGGGGGCDYFSVGCGVVLKLSPRRGGKWAADALYHFAASDGYSPQSTLIADSSGDLYGTTNAGGEGPGYFEGIGGQDCPYGCGTVFMVTRSSGGNWNRKVLYSFTGISGDGSFPWGNLTFDGAGNLYGTTEFGGAYGWGTVFELMPSSGWGWKEIVIYSFTGTSDGSQPVAGLIFDAAGNLYGTTSLGGDNPSCSDGCGTVFKLSPSGNAWTETVLYSFAGTNGDGAIPTASLIFDAAGNLYGTTSLGGGGDCGIGHCGTAFQLSPVTGGWKETVLHAFIGANGDGAGPQGNLTLDDGGDLYGTTFEGGTRNNYCPMGTTCGTVFKLTHRSGAWKETTIHSFGSHDGDGTFPAAGLTFDVAGNLYGTTGGGGAKDWGTVFKLARSSGGDWTESVIHSFAGYPSDGADPIANVTLDSEGNLYGTTSVGGAGGGGGFGGFQSFGGTVFEIRP
jgi:uncharacterized repeat protein (TIGR03803 family)